MGKLVKCSKCGVKKKQSEFFKDKQKKSGYRPDCKKCNVARNIAYQRKNKEQIRLNNIKWNTGLTAEQYSEVLIFQDNKCAICGKGKEEQNRNLSVDHCHKTKIIRGLLCNGCNQGLGYFKDNCNLLEAAIEYLSNNYSNRQLIHKEQKHKICQKEE